MKWEKYKQGDGYDKYFIYYRAREDNGYRYHRETRKEYEDKITTDIQHLPLEEIEEKIKYI